MKPKQQIYSLPHLTTLEPSQFLNKCLIKNKNVFSMKKYSAWEMYSVRESNSPLENENLSS